MCGLPVAVNPSIHFLSSLLFSSLPFPSLPFPSLPFPSLPFPSLPFPSLPFPSLPFPSLPFPSLPFPSLPFPSLPFPSLPFPSLLFSSPLLSSPLSPSICALVMKVKQALVNGGSKHDALCFGSRMPRHPTSDATVRINEIHTVPASYLATSALDRIGSGETAISRNV